MYNFSLVADFDENIVHNRRYDLIRMNLYFEVCILAEIAFIKWSVNLIWIYDIFLKIQIKKYPGFQIHPAPLVA